MADLQRSFEDRRIHKERFTYCCTAEEKRDLKIIAARLNVPANQFIRNAILFYLRNNFTQHQLNEYLRK